MFLEIPVCAFHIKVKSWWKQRLSLGWLGSPYLFWRSLAIQNPSPALHWNCSYQSFYRSLPSQASLHAQMAWDLPAQSILSLGISFSLRSCSSWFLLHFPTWFSSHLSVTFAGCPWSPCSLPVGLLQGHTWSFYLPVPHLSGNLIHKHTVCADDSQIHLCLPIRLFLSGLKFWPVLLAFPHECLASSSNLV